MSDGIALLLLVYHRVARERPLWWNYEGFGDLPDLCFEIPKLLGLALECLSGLCHEGRKVKMRISVARLLQPRCCGFENVAHLGKVSNVLIQVFIRGS